jgi:hypothetical protein
VRWLQSRTDGHCGEEEAHFGKDHFETAWLARRHRRRRGVCGQPGIEWTRAQSGHGRRTRRGSCFCGCPPVPETLETSSDNGMERRARQQAKGRKRLGPPALKAGADWAGGEKAAVAACPLAGQVWGRPSAGGRIHARRPGRGWACEPSGPATVPSNAAKELTAAVWRRAEPRRTRVKRAGGCARGAICAALGRTADSTIWQQLWPGCACALLRPAVSNWSGPGVKPCISHTSRLRLTRMTSRHGPSEPSASAKTPSRPRTEIGESSLAREAEFARRWAELV